MGRVRMLLSTMTGIPAAHQASRAHRWRLREAEQQVRPASEVWRGQEKEVCAPWLRLRTIVW